MLNIQPIIDRFHDAIPEPISAKLISTTNHSCNMVGHKGKLFTRNLSLTLETIAKWWNTSYIVSLVATGNLLIASTRNSKYIYELDNPLPIGTLFKLTNSEIAQIEEALRS